MIPHCNCPQCGVGFDAEIIDGQRRKFCSARCYWNSKRKKVVAKCKRCGKEFETFPSYLRVRAKYCSRDCYGAARLENARKKANCGLCGREFAYLSSKRKVRKFCSVACYRRFYSGANHHAWRGGLRDYDQVSSWRSIAARIRKRDDKKCQICGTPSRRGYDLPVDHIIPFRFVMCNDEINLLTLCRRCHMRKTAIERKLIRGDMVGFRASLNVIGYPKDKVERAISYWGQLSLPIFPKVSKGPSRRPRPSEVVTE